MQELQKALDEIIYSEDGAELVIDAQGSHGALADFVVDPHTKQGAYMCLAPADVMSYEAPRGFHVLDYLIQKDKNRVVVRSDSGTIYIVRPIETDEARNTHTYYPLDEEQQEYIRAVLTGCVRTQ